MEVDQAAIDEILASAEADTPESRIDKLEKELDVLKGSVKKLLLDLRETLNNLENPFQNLQNLAEGALVGGMPQQPPQIQVVPAQIPEPPKPEPEQVEKPEEKPETETKPEPEPEAEPAVEKDVEEVEPPEEDVVKELGESAEPFPEVMEEGGLSLEGDSLQVYSFEKPQKKGEIIQATSTFTKYDIVTLFNLMDWVKGMLEKYSVDSLRLMLELFASAGYITEDARDFVCKIAELVALNDGFEDMLLELYRLHKLMNPADTSMDSKLLSLILDKRL